MTLMDANLSILMACWTLFCIVAGFWMGRKTQASDSSIIEAVKDLSISRQRPAIMIEEDPFYEPMHGEKQQRIPTIEDDK